MVPHYFLILTLAITVSARTASHKVEKISEESAFGELKLAYETYKECSSDDIAHCLKQKLAKTLTRLARSDDLNVLNGVTIKKDKDAKVEVVEEAVPRGLDESSLDNLIMDKIIGFMQSHTFQVKFPVSSDLENETEEGRSRRKKIAPLLAIPILIMGMLVPLAFGALALLAGKALIVSKLALVLAGIIGLKKLLSSNHGSGHESHEVVVSAGHGGSGWSRSFDKSHDLAYSAYAQ